MQNNKNKTKKQKNTEELSLSKTQNMSWVRMFIIKS